MDQLEEQCGAEVDAILFCPSDHDDTPKLKVIGERHGIPPGDFATLVEAKKDAKRRSSTCDVMPYLQVMAGQLGMTLEEYIEWLDLQARIFDSLRVVDEYDDFRRPRQKSLFPLDPWEEEEEFLRGLQEDAGLQGD